MEVESIIPSIEADIHINKSNDGRYILSNEKLKHHLIVEENIVNIIQLVDGKRNLPEICEQYNLGSSVKIDAGTLSKILFENLSKYGIIKNSNQKLAVRPRAAYLKLSITLIPQKKVNIVSTYLSVLFKRKVAISLSILCLLIMVITGLQLKDFDFFYVLKELSLVNLYYFVPIILLDALFHEFGHVSALKKYGEDHGDIGFGFYLFTPAFYADVSSAWKLKSRERICVNLGGIYFNMLFISLISILYLILQEASFALMVFFLLLRILLNVNPFLRTDGYWIVSDLINVPNLRSNSEAKLKMIVSQFYKGISKIQFSKKDYFLALYAISSYAMVITYAGFVLIYDRESILYLPQNIYSVLNHLFTGNAMLIPLTMVLKIIMASIFYAFLIRYLVKYSSSFKKSQSSN